MTWTICPSCGWNYEQHGDTHMSTRFNCWRARNTSKGAAAREPMPVEAHTGSICSEADADWQTEAVKQIMAEQKLDFGAAYDVYIDQQRTHQLRMDALVRVQASGLFRPIDPVTKQPVP